MSKELKCQQKSSHTWKTFNAFWTFVFFSSSLFSQIHLIRQMREVRRSLRNGTILSSRQLKFGGSDKDASSSSSSSSSSSFLFSSVFVSSSSSLSVLSIRLFFSCCSVFIPRPQTSFLFLVFSIFSLVVSLHCFLSFHSSLFSSSSSSQCWFLSSYFLAYSVIKAAASEVASLRDVAWIPSLQTKHWY